MKVLHDLILVERFRKDSPNRIILRNQLLNNRVFVVESGPQSDVPTINPDTKLPSELVVVDLGTPYEMEHNKTQYFIRASSVLVCNGSAGQDYVAVRINKQLQSERRERTNSGIFLDDRFQFMQRNMQYGEVLSIGKNVKNELPDLKPNDTLIFHHSVEGSLEAKAQSYTTRYLVDTDDQYNYYCVRKDLIFGYSKDKSTIIPSDKWSFVRHFSKKSFDVFEMERHGLSKTDSGLIVPEFYESHTSIHSRLEELQKQSSYLSQSMHHEGVEERVKAIMAEMQSLTKKLNKKRIEEFEPVWVIEKYKGCSSICYEFVGEYPAEIEVFGERYFLLSNSFVVAGKRESLIPL